MSVETFPRLRFTLSSADQVRAQELLMEIQHRYGDGAPARVEPINTLVERGAITNGAALVAALRIALNDREEVATV